MSVMVMPRSPVQTTAAARHCPTSRRSSVVLEVASSGFLDPATSLLLAGAAIEARGDSEPASVELAQPEQVPTGLAWTKLAGTELAQSNLSKALRAAFAQPGVRASLTGQDSAAELLAELEAAAHQVLVARKFYNTAVAVTREARRKPLVRVLRLAGKAGLPEFFEMDDSLATEDDDGTGADMQRLAG